MRKTTTNDIALGALSAALFCAFFILVYVGLYVVDAEDGWGATPLIILTWISGGIAILLALVAAVAKIIEIGVRSGTQ